MMRMKLNEICEVYSGYALKSFNDAEDGLPVVKIGNILTDGTLNLDECQYTTDSVNEKYYSNKGDIYIALSGATTGKIGIMDADERYVVNQRVGIVRKKSDDVPQEYIKYFLLRQTDRIMQEAAGCAQPNISPKQIAEYSVPEITKEKMFEVCGVLDKTKRIIDMRKAELTALDDLIKARFVEMFGNGHDGVCNVKMLGDFCKFQQGTQVPVEEQIEEPLDGYTRFLRIIDYTQAPQPPRYVSVKGREIEADSVVIVRYGATAGFVGHGYEGILANNLFEVVPDETILSKDFLYLALKYGTFEQEVHDKAFGAAMPALSFGMMNDISVVTPSSDEQDCFVDFVHQVDKSKVAVQKSLDETQQLFDSLMQKYFG